MQFYGFARVHEDGWGIGTDHLQVLIYKDQSDVMFLELDSRNTSKVCSIDQLELGAHGEVFLLQRNETKTKHQE